jgi:hypothetical protein
MKLFLLLIIPFAIFNNLYSQIVTCKCGGQLGNQLFVIASATSYGLEHNLETVFPFILQSPGGKENIKNVFPSINTGNFPKNFTSITEKKQRFYNPLPFKKGTNYLLKGYFQSEKYFKNHSTEIRSLFKPSDETQNYIFKHWKVLLDQNCVALHFRTFHTDAPNTYATNRFGKERVLKYFKDAIEFFPKDHIFLVFSDDVDYCLENLPIKDKDRFFLIKDNPRHIDLYLMSFCKHQIVSPDSTFSWWAAWLNENPNKVVISSKIDIERGQTDYIPESWIKL